MKRSKKKKQLIKQSPRYNSCLAWVLGILVDEPEDYVLDWFEHKGKPPVSEADAFIFLAHHGIYLAQGINFAEHDEEGTYITVDTPLKCTYTLREEKIAFLIVDSPAFLRTTKRHIVFWNGTHVLDPAWNKPQALENYKIRDIYPMMFSVRRYDNKELLIKKEKIKK